MTDSEDDVLSSNVYSFPNDRPTIRAKGPNYTNISTFSCRNNILTSTMHQPRNFERRNLNYDQRSLNYKRDTSPMSLRSVPDFRPRNFHHPFSVGGPGYGRSWSPTSVRSIDTNVSMSASDIALAIKNEAYNKHDLKLIKEALNKQFKRKLRRRVEKRRNQRLLLHMSKRKSGDDSGEQGSDSSVSSDDCRSVRTAPCIANNSKYKTKFSLTNLKMTVNEGNMYNDCTKDIRRKSLKNMICSDASPAKRPTKTKEVIHSNIEKGVLLKNRFKNGFLLPLDRFNKSLKESSHSSKLDDSKVHSNHIINAKQLVNNYEIPKNNVNEDMENEQEEIFTKIPTIGKKYEIDNISHKRSIDLDELHCNPQKKSKVTITQSQKTGNERNCTQNDIESEFIFAKPQMPVRKSGNTKKKLHSSPEQLISKSQQPLFDLTEHSQTMLSPVKELAIQKYPKRIDDIELIQKDNRNKECDKPLSDDISMQPSFIKRKLFTQKLDVAEKKNMSDSSLSSSPQVKNVNGIKEKCKTRKLASSQSCLSRDILEEDNNFLDLIHKIVPADQINITNACNRNSQRDSNEKWDVTSVISSCIDKDISDTYTDEEIFKVDNHCNSKSKICTITKFHSKLTSNCKIVLEKLPLVQLNTTASNIACKQTTIKKAKECGKENIKVTLKSFWDTDTESELETYESSCNVNDSQINNKVEKSINKIKHCKKQQCQKVECMSVEAKRAIEVRNKSQKGVNVRNAAGAKTAKIDKRKISPESKENNNNLINISYSSDRNTQATNKLNESSKTVTLISHRMGRPKRQITSIKMNTIESPSSFSKDLNNSITENKKPIETSNVTKATSHRTGRSKSQVKSTKIIPVQFLSPKSTDNSSSDLNISIKSLRSYNKNNKVNEKVVARNLKSRNRSGVKGI